MLYISTSVWLLSTQNAESAYFDKRFGCAALKRLLKNTTIIRASIVSQSVEANHTIIGDFLQVCKMF